MIGEIESASREQSTGIEQINRAVMQMDQITQRDAEMAQGLISTAQTLQNESQQMLAAISAFPMQVAQQELRWPRRASRRLRGGWRRSEVRVIQVIRVIRAI